MVVCKLSKDDKLFVENLYNNGKTPQTVDEIYVNIGLSNRAFSLENGIFTCSFTRIIKSDEYVDKFFDLNTPFYVLLAKGRLNAAGKFIFFIY